MSYLLGVDVGTTSIKCVLFNEKGRVIVSEKREYELFMPQPEFVEIEAETYWSTFKECLSKVLNKSKINAQNILGIGIASQGETFVTLDKSGIPLRRVIVWLDNRSKEETEIIKREFGADEVYRITGQNEVVPTWTATKILWLKRNEPEVFRRAYKYLLLEDYLIYKLTGKFVTEYSVASSSLLFDISRRVWWNDILEFIGITEDNLPELKPSGTSISNVAPEAAKETGLHVNTVVSTGAYDQAANAIGVGNIKSGIISETTGAALAIVATTDQIILDPMRRIPCHHHAAGEKYFLQPWCPTAGILLKWYKDNFGLVEVQVSERIGLDPYDLLTLEAAKVPPGSEGLVLLPHFMGAASPEFDSNAKGVLFGLTLHHGRGHIIRTIMEAVAYMLRRNIELLEDLGVRVNEIRCTGGAARSRLWNQIKADVVQKTISTVRIEETATLGAAILASLATKTYNSLENASNFMVSIKEKFFPSENNREVYNKSYNIYINLYEKLKELFKERV